jgi:hypothetical protein
MSGSLPLPTNVQHFGSIMFPFENGRTTDPAKNGQFTVNNFRTQASGTNSATDYWRNAYSCVVFCDPHRERIDGQNFFPMLFGTNTNSVVNRTTGLRYYPLEHPTASKRQKFEFWARGEAGPGTWLLESAVIPTSARGPFVVWAWNDGTNGYLHVYDIDGATWYDGDPVAKPNSWIGVSSVALTNDLVIGAALTTFPFDNSGGYHLAAQWRGSMGDILFCNAALSKANIESMVAGSNPVTVATGAGATVYCHLPLTTAGDIDLTAATTFSGISVTQQGTVWPGETLRRQGATNWITLKPYFQPEHFPVPYGSTNARVRLRGNVGGLTGSLRFRIVRDNGDALTPWSESGITVTGGAFDGYVSVPEWTGKAQIQVKMSSNDTIIASTHAFCTSGPVIEMHAQSEGVFASTQGRHTAGIGTNFTLPPDCDTISFAAFNHLTTDKRMIMVTQDQTAWVGEGCAAIAQRIRQYSNRSVHIRLNCVIGTSPLALMNDDDTSRKWSDLEALRAFMTARGPSNEAVVTAHLIFGWEASLSPVNPMPVAYRPLLTGVGSNSGTYNASSNIPTADIDHYLFDGSSSLNAATVINPCNRATTGSGATNTDNSNEADSRDHFRNYSHIYNYLVGPEVIGHKMEGENSAGGLPSGSVTHPEPGDFEGSTEVAVAAADAMLQIIAPSTAYPGPVFFETISAGTAANKVKVRLGLPRPNPGQGLPEGATGYSTAAQSGSYTYNLHVKKTGGDPGAGFEASIDGGAWSKSNVVSGVITDAATGEVELTLASTPSTSVAIRYVPGSPGRYSAATITQENWRSGLLLFGGSIYASGEPNSLDDLNKLGWYVAGSNQALVLTL